MKTNVVTKLIWLAACAAVMFSAENVVRAEMPATHQASVQPSAGGNAYR